MIPPPLWCLDLQELVGGTDAFHPFLRAYLARFRFSTLTSSDFRAFFCEHFKAEGAQVGETGGGGRGEGGFRAISVKIRRGGSRQHCYALEAWLHGDQQRVILSHSLSSCHQAGFANFPLCSVEVLPPPPRHCPHLPQVDWDTWYFAPGMPPVANVHDTSLADQAYELAKRWHTCDVMGIGSGVRETTDPLKTAIPVLADGCLRGCALFGH